jgi:iron-sulfur cluster repair protein YtfE (RIC family)
MAAADSGMPMDVVDLDSSVPDWLIEHPHLLPLFRELGIDYCCGGKSLDTAAREQGLDPQYVLSRCRALNEAASKPPD